MAKYVNKRRLGSGGFSEVWSTTREEDGVIFAKKVLLDVSPEGVKRFQREVRIVSRLDHPRIVRILAKRLDEPPYWYVMPLYRGSLRKEFPAIVGDDARIGKVFLAILEGMQYAHEQGIIHRDLKPENILLNNDDDLVISDFGLGRAFDAATTRATFTGQSMGTVGYTAPEQMANAKNVDHVSDIYSLGRILYELYSGQPATEIQDLHLLPVGISAIVDRCTKADPKRRFQSVEELRNAYASFAMVRGRRTPHEKIRTLLGEAIADGTLADADAHELANLIAQAREDTDLLHDVCIEIPASVFETLWEVNPIAAKVLVKVFTDQVSNQGWPFDYTDKIGAACMRLHNATPDHEIRGMLVAAVLEVGVSHSRWRVMDIAVELLCRRREPEESLAVAHAVAECGHHLKVLGDRVERARLDPAIADLFATVDE